MFIAVAVGVLSGLVGVLCWFLFRLALNLPGLHAQLEGQWYLVAPVIGATAAAAYALVRAFVVGSTRYTSAVAGRIDRRQPLGDLFESYHFGIFRIRPLTWLARGTTSLLGALWGGIFGVEGGILEFSFASLPLLSRYMRLFIEEKQTFAICTISASLSVALGAPFAGALVALELVHAVEGRIRAGAIVSALTAHGTALFLQSVVFTSLAENALGSSSLLAVLFSGLRPMSLEAEEWVMLGGTGIIVGLIVAAFAMLTIRMLVRGSEFFTQFFGERQQLGMLVGGLLIGASVWLVPEAFTEPGRLAQDIAWQRFSSAGAAVLLFAKWGILILAFSSWGSSGIFLPMMMFGALLGYGFGNVVESTWALPLAIAGAAAALTATFRVPIAAAAMVLEVGRDGSMWGVAALAVAGAAVLCRLLQLKPLHEVLLDRRGIRIVGGRAANVLVRLRTADAMHSDVVTIRENSTVQELRNAVAASRHTVLGVCAPDGKYLGLLALEQLPVRIRRAFAPDATQAEVQAVERVVEIRDLVDTYNPTISPNDSLEKALGLFQKTPYVSVVDENCQLCGFLFESSIAGIYKREVASVVLRQS